MIRRILLKTLILFSAFNLLFVLTTPLSWLGRISLYNQVFPGRPRLPWGEHPDQAYNLTLDNLDAMFAAHEISAGVKPAEEFRVVLIGDSSTWGFLLHPDETLAAQLNALHLAANEGRHVRVYNLGYPDFSLTKDALILNRAMRYQPDLVVWLMTLRSFPVTTQLHPLVQANLAEATQAGLAQSGHLSESLVARWLGAQRRALADLMRLQCYGVPWAATGIDQVYPADYERWQNDLEADDSFQTLKPQTFKSADLAFDIITRARQIVGNTPLLIVNEPMAIATGKNSALRYNFFYPRWAYDQYRNLMTAQAQQQGWRYLDLWNAIPSAEFTNSAVHLTPRGSQLLAERLAVVIIE